MQVPFILLAVASLELLSSCFPPPRRRRLFEIHGAPDELQTHKFEIRTITLNARHIIVGPRKCVKKWRQKCWLCFFQKNSTCQAVISTTPLRGASKIDDEEIYWWYFGPHISIAQEMLTLKVLPYIYFMVTLQSSMIQSNFHELEWTMSSKLSQWYSALDMCLISSSSTKEVEEILSDCRKLHLKEANNQPVRCTLGNSWPSKSGFCSSSDIPYALRKNFRNAVKGFDDPSSHPLQKFFGELSKRKSSVILIGDSVMQQFFSALACELEREGMWKDPSQFKNTDEIRLVPGYRPEDPAVPIKFTPIYHFVNGRYDRVANASMVAMKKSIDDFVQSYKSVVIIVNMGLHYVSNPIAQFSRIDYIEQMTAALRYLHSVSLHWKGVKVYWRETTAQHFPTPNGCKFPVGHLSVKTTTNAHALIICRCRLARGEVRRLHESWVCSYKRYIPRSGLAQRRHLRHHQQEQPAHYWCYSILQFDCSVVELACEWSYEGLHTFLLDPHALPTHFPFSCRRSQEIWFCGQLKRNLAVVPVHCVCCTVLLPPYNS